MQSRRRMTNSIWLTDFHVVNDNYCLDNERFPLSFVLGEFALNIISIT